MTNGKKKRMSMLDSLAASGGPAPVSATSMMSNNRALRSARDAVDGHRVWELDPAAIIDDRLADRLEPEDVADLRAAIEANGQTVPILVRRHPTEPDQYLLVYGRRRLESIRLSDKVEKVRALVANLDDDAALRAQISENMARRDLSYIEKALFSQELIENGFGTQSQVAEVLTVTKSSISMALAVVDMIGADVIRAIGAAHGIGRPRWDALAKMIEAKGVDRAPPDPGGRRCAYQSQRGLGHRGPCARPHRRLRGGVSGGRGGRGQSGGTIRRPLPCPRDEGTAHSHRWSAWRKHQTHHKGHHSEPTGRRVRRLGRGRGARVDRRASHALVTARRRLRKSNDNKKEARPDQRKGPVKT